MSGPILEAYVHAVGKDLRFTLSQSMLQRVGWIAGKQPVDAWLLLGGPGRCRLLSAAELEDDPLLQALRARITSELEDPSASAIEFRDEVSVALALRLAPVRITPPPPVWRLTLPAPIAAIMQIRPGQSEIASLFSQGHLELWTIETLRSAVTLPLTEIL